MRFSICIMETEGYKYSHFLYDVCKNYCYIIERAGYECCMVRNTLYSDRINIIMGTHTLTDPAKVEQIIRSGKYVILQSEVLRENGIAGWPDQKTFHTIYVPLMRHAQAVWDGLEINHPHLRKLGIEPELSVTRFGYLPAMEEIHHKKTKDIDFLYFGSLTPHRMKLIDNIKAKGGNVVYAFDEAAIFRNDLIARTRVNLAPNQAPGINHVTSKVLYLLNNRCVVVVERCSDQDWVEHCFPSADTEEWVDLCLETIKRPDLDQLADKYFEQYKKLDMTDIIRPLLDKLRPEMPAMSKGEIISIELSQNPTKNIDADKDAILPYFKEVKAVPCLTSIVIVTHNHLEHTKKCLKSIRRHTKETHEIIFVDNASTDGTVKWLQSQVRENKNYHLIENKENLGLTKGRNQGIKASPGEFILLLDNDVIVSEGWLSGMLECLNYAPASGIIGPMTNSADGLQQVADESYRSIDYLDKYAAIYKEQYRHRRIPYRKIAGFCMLFKRILVEKVGLFDESFGNGHFENEDFCLRASLEGYRNYIVGDIFVHHYGDEPAQNNRKTIEAKWTLSTATPDGKKLAVQKAIEVADDIYSKGNIDQAVEVLINCIKVAHEAKEIYYSLTRMFIEMKRFSEAWEVIGTMPETAKNSLKGMEYAGYAREGLGLDDEASACVDRMLELDEKYPAALNLRGVLAYKRGEKEKAEDDFQKSVHSNPGYGEAYTNLGVLCWGTDKKEEALAYLQKGFVLSPTLPDAGSLYYSVVSSLGAYADAESDFREASRLYFNNKNLIFLYIDILIQQGKFVSAMLQIEDALDTFGFNEETLIAALAVRNKIGPLQIDKTAKKSTLSLCMIVKNEENYLAKCLKSVRDVVDEIIIVDTGSTDKTRDIATIFGAKVFDFPWTGDFSAARNHSLQQATGSWILVLDADEVISRRDIAELKRLIQQGSSAPTAYFISTRNYITNASVNGFKPNTGEYPEEAGPGYIISTKVRLYRRSQDIYFINPVHELLEDSLKRAKIRIHASTIIVHHYGKLDNQKDIKKGEVYYVLGKMKYESDPNNMKYILELAKQAQILNKFEEAVKLWLKLIALIDANPDSPDYREIVLLSPEKNPLSDAYVQLAAAYLSLNLNEEALVASRKAMEINKTYPVVATINSYCEIVAGSLEKAVTVLKEILKTEPDYPPALLQMAIVSCLEGKKDDVQKYFELLLKKGFNIADFLNIMARHLLTNKRKDQALLLINAMVENKINDAQTSLLLDEINPVTEG